MSAVVKCKVGSKGPFTVNSLVLSQAAHSPKHDIIRIIEVERPVENRCKISRHRLVLRQI